MVDILTKGLDKVLHCYCAFKLGLTFPDTSYIWEENKYMFVNKMVEEVQDANSYFTKWNWCSHQGYWQDSTLLTCVLKPKLTFPGKSSIWVENKYMFVNGKVEEA